MMCGTRLRYGLLLAAFAIAAVTSTSVEAAGKKAASKAAPQGGGIVQLLKDLLGVTDLEEAVADLQAQNADQQSAIDALLAAVGDLNATVGQHSTDIAALQACCADLQQRVAALEAVVNCQQTICTIDGIKYCINTQTDHDNCGACNTPCAANQDCVGGMCQLKVCNPIDQCHNATLMMDGTCVQTNKPNTTVCDDGFACTVSDLCQSGVCVGFGTPCDQGACAEDGMGGFTCE